MSPNDIASRAYVDEIQGRLRDELVAHLDEIDEREASTRRAFEAEMRVRVEDSEARAQARHAVIARELRVTRLAEAASRCMAHTAGDVDVALVHAAYLVAECERIVDAPAAKVSP